MATTNGRLTALVTPSPFAGGGREADVEVAVHGGQLTMTDGRQVVAVSPTRATMGHGTLHVRATELGHPLLLTFERYDVSKERRQHGSELSGLYGRLNALGLRELLVGLRESGVRVKTAPVVRHGAAVHRAGAWVGASGLLFVELALFGLPAGGLGALLAGALTTGSPAGDVVFAAGLVAFLLLAIAVSPIPLVVRGSFELGGARDPIRYLDTWAGRPPEQRTVERGQRLVFVPGVPLVPALILAAACAFYASRAHLTMFTEVRPPATTPTGQPVVPEPDWLDGGVVSLAGYAGMVLLLVIFGISVIRWRQLPALYSIRWAPLVGAFLCFAFGQAGGEVPQTPLEQWFYLGVVILLVAFTAGRVALGFGVFALMALLLLLAAFGFFDNASTAALLLPVLALLVAIAVRYAPGGARRVALPEDRAERMQRTVWALWAVTVVLGLGLTVAAAQTLQPVAG